MQRARAEDFLGCFADNSATRIESCTRLLDQPGLGGLDRSLAYAMRGLGHALKGDFASALPDYDAAIALDPTSAIALNNRAWTLFKSGDPSRGLPDVERSLMLAPGSAHAHDTRAHIHQSEGRSAEALADYERAMRFGGSKIVKLYQCGLAVAGLYKGEVDGLYRAEVAAALEACVKARDCDPLPPDEDCRYTTS